MASHEAIVSGESQLRKDQKLERERYSCVVGGNGDREAREQHISTCAVLTRDGIAILS